MDGGAWWATGHGVAKSRTRLSYLTFTFRGSLWARERKIQEESGPRDMFPLCLLCGAGVVACLHGWNKWDKTTGLFK